MHLGEPPPAPEVEQLSESAAAAKAVKTSLEYFLDQLRRGKGEKFYVRASFLGTEDDSEVLWVSNIHIRGRTISGKLAQTPTLMAGAKKGAVVKCSVDDIVDWLIIRNGKTYGGFTEHPKL